MANTVGRTTTKEPVAKRILNRLREFKEALESGQRITGQFTCRRFVLDLKHGTYTPQRVKKVRDLLGASQGVFAQLMGVSVRTVQAWERGANEPSEMACRWLHEIERDPGYWLERLRTAVVPKNGTRQRRQ